MSIKQYNLWNNFKRVYPQFIDTRLTNRWIKAETDKDGIANTITHLLIYNDAISISEIEEIKIIDTLMPIDIETQTIYSFNNHLNITYNITKENMQKIMYELKDLIKELKTELKNGYTPISEHKHNEKSIEKIEKVIYWIAGIFVT